jgi:PhoPQ-activated pathogenicity-related protein
MAPYYNAILNNIARPAFSCTINEDDSITVETTDAPQAVYLWQITNPTTRDFRLSTTGANWSSTMLTSSGGGVYIADVPEPANGWTAFFVELVYTSSMPGYNYHFTSEMVVVPEILPYEADFNRDTIADTKDLLILAEVWLTENDYRDIAPRRGGGDGIINFNDFANFSLHWMY